jgi:hypothetical protein
MSQCRFRKQIGGEGSVRGSSDVPGVPLQTPDRHGLGGEWYARGVWSDRMTNGVEDGDELIARSIP